MREGFLCGGFLALELPHGTDLHSPLLAGVKTVSVGLFVFLSLYTFLKDVLQYFMLLMCFNSYCYLAALSLSWHGKVIYTIAK